MPTSAALMRSQPSSTTALSSRWHTSHPGASGLSWASSSPGMSGWLHGLSPNSLSVVVTSSRVSAQGLRGHSSRGSRGSSSLQIQGPVMMVMMAQMLLLQLQASLTCPCWQSRSQLAPCGFLTITEAT